MAGVDYINEDKAHWVHVQGLLLRSIGRVSDDFKDGVYRVGESMVVTNPDPYSPHAPYVAPPPRELKMKGLSVTSYLMQEDRKWRDKLLPAERAGGQSLTQGAPDHEILP